MAEQFQGGVCEGNWWINSLTNLFRSSPCPSSINDPGSFGWMNHEPIIDMKTARSVSDDDSSCSDSDRSCSIVLQDVQEPSDENVSIASTLQMMGINLSSSTTTDDNWNQDYLLHDNIGRPEQNYSNQMLQSTTYGFINSSMPFNSFRQEDENIPFNSDSYGDKYNSTLLQTLFDTDSYLSSPNYMNSTEFCPSLTKDSKPSFPKQQHLAAANNHFQFTNNTPFWNAGDSNFLPSSQTQFVLPSSLNSAKPNLRSLSTKQHKQEAGSLNSMAPKKFSNEPPFKRPRIETPSPLPTFKVRKEKMGDRITALQQLVSPFGKTDTASVLHEAIEYIKFLHDQVSVLSTPYLKNGSPRLQHQQAVKDEKVQILQDLKSRGLCLVPISSTFPVSAETTTDFWSPTFGGCFR